MRDKISQPRQGRSGHDLNVIQSLHEPLCKARYYDVAASRMLRRAPLFTVGNWGSTNAGFTMRTGLAELICLHPFGPFRFTDMLLSPSGFPSRLAGCPRRCWRSRPPAPLGQSHVRRSGAPQQSGWHPQPGYTWKDGKWRKTAQKK
jgi:hypothetical protein